MKLPQSLNVLLLGSGGREHAFARSMARSERLSRLYIAPGNAGTAQCGTNVDLSPLSFGSVKAFVLRNHINLVVVGPEEPLVRGVADYFAGDSDIYHIPVIGPMAAGARLEGSKEFAKGFMQRHGIPTAAYAAFDRTSLDAGRRFLDTLRPPYVLKADGLAAGKGVVILEDREEAARTLEAMVEGKYGQAASRVLVEEYLHGIECSVFVATDGEHYRILPVAKDYKRIGEGDTGPNTGGMGAVSPVPFADADFMRRVEERIVVPTVSGLREEGIDYRGFLFIGLMRVDGEPYVIEYNARMGDPETQAVLPRIESDIMELFEGIAFGTLDRVSLVLSPLAAATVVATSAGYPGPYGKGEPIHGLEPELPHAMVFHGGTALSRDEVVTAGGRVLSVTALGPTLDDALRASYARLRQIDFEGIYFRRDIGADVLSPTNGPSPSVE